MERHLVTVVHRRTGIATIPEGGGSGMIVTMGGRFGGYGLYLLRGKPVFDYNFLDLEHFRWEGGVGAEDWLGSSLKPGKHTIVFDFKYDGPGPAKGGSGVLSVDGKEYARKTIPHTIPFLISIDESFDIEELADELGISLTAAKSRVHRARTKLRKTVEECCRLVTDPYGRVMDWRKRPLGSQVRKSPPT
jgi:hypothetical protein